MKLTTIKFIKLNLLVLCISVITNANAKLEDECEKQLLSTQGLSVSGNTISPGQTFPISLVSDKGKVEGTIELSLKKMKNAVVVDGEIKNVGNCVISTFMPVGLHPIKNGLPLKWHTLPEGLKHSSPTLKPGEFVKFFKKYSKEYAWGFNIKVGTFWLIPSDKPAENNLDACSDKAIAKQLEKIADQETKSELDVCQSAEALKRVNETTLELIDKCSTKSKATELLQKDIKNNIAETNQRMKNYCENFLEAKLDTREVVSPLKDNQERLSYAEKGKTTASCSTEIANYCTARMEGQRRNPMPYTVLTYDQCINMANGWGGGFTDFQIQEAKKYETDSYDGPQYLKAVLCLTQNKDVLSENSNKSLKGTESATSNDYQTDTRKTTQDSKESNRVNLPSATGCLKTNWGRTDKNIVWYKIKNHCSYNVLAKWCHMKRCSPMIEEISAGNSSNRWQLDNQDAIVQNLKGCPAKNGRFEGHFDEKTGQCWSYAF